MRIYVENTTKREGGVKVDGRSGEFSFHTSYRTPTLAERGRAHWAKLHARRMTPAELDEWEKAIPSFGCDCAAKYAGLKAANPPRFNDWGRWTWEIHNAVNSVLEKPFFDWAGFHRAHPEIAYPKQPPLSGLVAVTSLSPHRFERQTVCLDSWRKLGLEIIAVNSPAEIDSMRNAYPVSKWVEAEANPTPKINSLIDVAAAENTAILVINSDIEIYGDQSRLADLVASRKNAIGIRHNYAARPGDSAIEPWGLDAYLIYPEQVATLSRVGFTIGKPMWDYWLATELEAMGVCEWIGEPYFYHRAHPVAWSQAECTAAHHAYAERFQPMDWAAWRQSKPFSQK